MRSLLHRGYTSALQPLAERQIAKDLHDAEEHEAVLVCLSNSVAAVLSSYLKRREGKVLWAL